MKPMDFEEFLWAKGVDDKTVEHLKRCFDSREPAGEPIESMMERYFKEYICVGGMPRAVSVFIDTNNFNTVLEMQRDLLEQHRDDFGKFIDEKGEVQIDIPLKIRINAVFDSIPAQLAKEYKKFQYSKLKPGARSSEYRDAIQWLEDAGLITLCHNLKLLSLPLEGNKDPDTFKLYMADTGLLVAMLEDGTVTEIIDGDLGIYKGAIYEEIVADMLSKMHRPLYFYRRDSSLAIDFIIRYEKDITLLEVKSKDGRTKAARTILDNQDLYGVRRCIKLTGSRTGESNGIITIPQYMMPFLEER